MYIITNSFSTIQPSVVQLKIAQHALLLFFIFITALCCENDVEYTIEDGLLYNNHSIQECTAMTIPHSRSACLICVIQVIITHSMQ